jgi:hypothetical protein
MARVLTKLKINEVSAVDRGAGEGCEVVLWKRDDSPRQRQALWNKAAIAENGRRPLLFNDIMLAKRSEVTADEDDVRDEDDSKKLSGKLREMVAAMIVAAPGLKESDAMHFLMHHPQGRRLAEHLNSISKHKEEPMLDISKLISVVEDGLNAQAQLRKRDGESDAKTFSRTYETDIGFRKQCQVVQEAKHLIVLASRKSYPSLMSLEPVSVGVGATDRKSDAKAAYEQGMKLAEEQRAKAPWLSVAQCFARVIPTALIIDCCPSSGGD